MNDRVAGASALAVPGVTLAAVEAGVRYENRRDLVALRFAEGTTAAAMFTRNAFCAAPVTVAREHLAACHGMPRLLLINTGNANAGTGEAGLAAARHCCEAAAATAQVAPTEVLPFSTGVIGEDLPVNRICDALPALHESLSADSWEDAAWGILTTDTRPKAASRQISIDGRTITITGIAKGAGMLRPNMATMLAFVATDAPIPAPLLQELLEPAVECSFHRITVDGDTSTNDAVLLAATGQSGGSPWTADDSEALASFGEALASLCVELAQGLVRDAEGATRFVEVSVTGGRSAAECLDVAFTVAHSPLVKTALFAGDPNWGRILAAIGRAGVEDLDVSGVEVSLNGLPIAAGGARAASYDESAMEAAMQSRDLVMAIDLGRGDAGETVWTSDLSYDYVRINAEYRS